MKLMTFSLCWVLFAAASVAQDSIAVDKLPFSAAREAGNTLYVSGQIAISEDGKRVIGSVSEETHQVMKNLERILKDHEYGLDDVVSVTVYLATMDDYAEMNETYRTYFKNGFPARACVGGLQLAFGLKMEIRCIAYKDAEPASR